MSETAITDRDRLVLAVARVLADYEISSGSRVGCVLMLGDGHAALYFNGERFQPYAKLRSVR